MAYFRITLLRSAIGLPRKTTGVLQALGLKKRLRTVYHPVSPSVAGQIFAVKELVDVQEVDRALSDEEVRELRRPETGYYIEKKIREREEPTSWTPTWTPASGRTGEVKAMEEQKADEAGR